MGKQLDLLIRAEGSRDPVVHQRCDDRERLDVRELTTRVVMRIRAGEISPYRHTLIIDGRAYRILDIVRVS